MFGEMINIDFSTDTLWPGLWMLSLIEHKAVLSAISMIGWGDPKDTVYRFDCKEFIRILGRENCDTYGWVKRVIRKIADKSWTDYDTNGKIKKMKWFEVVGEEKRTPYIDIRFDDSVAPFLTFSVSLLSKLTDSLGNVGMNFEEV